MKLLRSTLLATIAAGACSLSFAQSGKKPAPPVATISKVTALSFDLTQVATEQLADGTSTSLYQGNTLLFVLPCDGSWPTMLNVDVELKTTTMLNGCGDGLTDGVITLREPFTKQMITGPLMAVNTDNGDLTGIVEGRANIFGPSSARLRAAFHAVFVPDANGAYTVVNVDTHGVLFTATPPAGKK